MAKKTNNAGPTLGFEAQLWAAADKLRGNMEPSDYKHVALGLIFLKYISDARKLGHMIDRTRKEFSDEDIARVADTYRAWRGAPDAAPFEDEPGFCRTATLEKIREHSHVLPPGRYVGAALQEDDGEPFEDKMNRLSAQLREQQAEGAMLDAAIAQNLERLGFGQK